nr:Chain O, AIM12 from Autophagy-related protein 3 [Arabidopsis thaliana]7EU4_P Chain P, AIM12 from Autophagy-related protein 3 [Arabidopsis thaliana]7EU4_Q Chain Q, AIM12 from Autophagy-related protein 3 [Arabidopsis thaliana]7EU4_R Chain R, AIM12 from Autophagy-related protein 3 [Arabidopsis thaliana]
DDIPDMEEFDE